MEEEKCLLQMPLVWKEGNGRLGGELDQYEHA